MGETRQVMERMGIFAMAEKLGFDVLIFDELTKPQDWMLVRTDGDHWQNGFPVPHRLLEADAVVQTCCLKPHRFGGHFTLSLKNTVGMIGKHMGNAGYNYMTELHSSPSQRLMIAEANAVYNPDLILLDGGLGYLNMTVGILNELGFAIPIVAVAKGKTRKNLNFQFPISNKFLMTKFSKEMMNIAPAGAG